MTECIWRRGLSKCIKTVFTRLKQKVPKIATFLTEIDGWFVLSWFAGTFSFIIILNSDLDAFIVFVLAGIDMFFFHRRVFIIEMFFYTDAIVNEACRATNVLLSAAVGLYLIVFSNIIIGFFFSYKLWVLVPLTRSNFNLTWLEPDLNSSGASGT